MNIKTASKIEVGDIIRKYAPYEYWLDYQAVTEVTRVSRQTVQITCEGGRSMDFSANARFEIKPQSANAADQQVQELAACIAARAQAIADGTSTGPVHASVALLVENVKTLETWTAPTRD